MPELIGVDLDGIPVILQCNPVPMRFCPSLTHRIDTLKEGGFECSDYSRVEMIVGLDFIPI
jgi:hypothetical protein